MVLSSEEGGVAQIDGKDGMSCFYPHGKRVGPLHEIWNRPEETILRDLLEVDQLFWVGHSPSH